MQYFCAQLYKCYGSTKSFSSSSGYGSRIRANKKATIIINAKICKKSNRDTTKFPGATRNTTKETKLKIKKIDV